MSKKMNYSEALEAMKNGAKVKLPEWDGYWFMKDYVIRVYTSDCRELDTPYFDDYKSRKDWIETDGSRDYGGAIKALKAGKRVQRKGWNGKGMFIFQRPSDVLAKEFIPKVKSLPKSVKDFLEKENRNIEFTAYLCMWTADGKVVNGWLASQTDMLSEDWMVLED